MEFEGPDEQEEEMGYDALGNSLRGVKMGGSGGGGGETVASTAAASRKSGSRYRECLKNHAVSIGGNAVDGCGEFMPAGEEGTMDALKCAACNCHRNFHRKETEGAESFHHHFSPYYRNFPAGYLHLAAHHRPPPLALPSTSGGGGGAHSGGEQDDVSNPSAGGVATPGSGTGGKKRFRTKFTQEQKDKMLAFAESLGWRIQKHDEVSVQQFCADTCIKRHVLKVWMHNNKHTLGKKL